MLLFDYCAMPHLPIPLAPVSHGSFDEVPLMQRAHFSRDGDRLRRAACGTAANLPVEPDADSQRLRNVNGRRVIENDQPAFGLLLQKFFEQSSLIAGRAAADVIADIEES